MNGCQEVTTYLGFMYICGNGVDKNVEKGLKYMEKAAMDCNDVNAMYNLGALFQNGQELEKDLKKARYWLEKAAENGSGIACFNLGLLNESSDNKKELEERFEWHLRGASLGNTECMRSIIRCYREGIGTDRSDSEAERWHDRCIEVGKTDFR